MAGGRRLRAGGQRQVRPPARDWRRRLPSARRRRWCSRNSGRSPTRCWRFWATFSTGPGWCCTAARPWPSGASWSESFQRDDGPPFFLLTVKAGGSGLNLTQAAHVIHFDRWWNPAVENQATDRAFRIGQNQNVLVHKFVCRGTIEERIDAVIEDKKSLSAELLEGGGEKLLTEMSNTELLRFVALDLNRATEA